MSDQYYITQFAEEHVDQTASLMTNSFLKLNTIWQKYQPTYDQIFPIMRGKIIPAVTPGWSYVLVKNKKIIATCIQYDLLDYLKNPTMPNDLQLFKALGKAGQELEQSLDLTGLKQGDAIYGAFSVMDPDEANRGYSMKFWWHQLSIGKTVGWKYYYSRISSPISLKMVKKLGAEVLAEVQIEGINGVQKIWMVKMLFENLPPFSVLYELSNSKKQQIKPKL